MASSQAVIRPYESQDEKFVKFTLGKAALEPLANANHAVYTHPMAVAVWVALSSAMIQLMGWWPQPEHGPLGYARPLPAFGSMLVLIMLAVDWIHRSQFESLAQQSLRHPDFANLGAYYTRAGSGLWTLHLGTQFVGLVALDASPKPKSADATSSSLFFPEKGEAVIRHLYVEDRYRSAHVQDDLLAHALRSAFNAPKGPASVRMRTTGAQSYVEEALQRARFTRDDRATGWTGTVGLLSWKKREWVLQKGEWAAAQ